MYPYIHIVIPSYAMFAGIGALSVLVYLYFRIEKYEMEFGHFIKTFIVAVIFLVLGSKILFTVTQISEILEDFSIVKMIEIFLHSGFVYYGGLLGMLAGVYIYVSHCTQYNILNIYNMLTPAIPLFHTFGRIGCFMTGCCYGRKLANPVLINNYIQINHFPTQLVEAVFETIMFCVLLLLNRNKKRNLLKIYMLSYAIFRFIIEFFRGDVERGFCMGISTSQWISIFIFAGYVLINIRRNRRK